jgi:hypothetical protein
MTDGSGGRQRGIVVIEGQEYRLIPYRQERDTDGRLFFTKRHQFVSFPCENDEDSPGADDEEPE